MEPIELSTNRKKIQDEVINILEEAKSKGLLDIVLMGSLPMGEFFMQWSRSSDRIMQIGYLEMAKHHIISCKREMGD